jgi:hypothetical protein
VEKRMHGQSRRTVSPRENSIELEFIGPNALANTYTTYGGMDTAFLYNLCSCFTLEISVNANTVSL